MALVQGPLNGLLKVRDIHILYNKNTLWFSFCLFYCLFKRITNVGLNKTYPINEKERNILFYCKIAGFYTS